DARPHLAQAELHERVFRSKAHRLAGMASTPLAGVPDHDAALGVAVAPVDLLEHRGADQLARLRAVAERDAPQYAIGLCGRLFEERFLLTRARRMAVHEIAGHGHVPVPRLGERGGLKTMGLETDALTFDDGAKHGRITLSRVNRPKRRGDDMAIRLVVTITAVSGKGSELAQAYKARCAEAMKEPGCEQFEVFQGV